MNKGKKPMSARDRELLIRCILLMAGVIFFSTLAAVRAASADSGFDYRDNDPFWVDEDEYDVMSYDDHVMASRLRRQVVGTRPVYYRRKAAAVHDSVTIIVREDTSSELTSSNDLKRDSSQNWTLSNWITPKLSGGLGGTQHGQSAGGNTPTIAYNNNRAHKSDSTIDRSQTFTSTLTGEVIDVRPNGYLVVQAMKTVNVNGEEQTIRVTGTVNPSHMDSESSIDSDYIINMSVTYSGSGPMTRMDKRGWGSKLIDALNPF